MKIKILTEAENEIIDGDTLKALLDILGRRWHSVTVQVVDGFIIINMEGKPND